MLDTLAGMDMTFQSLNYFTITIIIIMYHATSVLLHRCDVCVCCCVFAVLLTYNNYLYNVIRKVENFNCIFINK